MLFSRQRSIKGSTLPQRLLLVSLFSWLVRNLATRVRLNATFRSSEATSAPLFRLSKGEHGDLAPSSYSTFPLNPSVGEIFIQYKPRKMRPYRKHDNDVFSTEPPCNASWQHRVIPAAHGKIQMLTPSHRLLANFGPQCTALLRATAKMESMVECRLGKQREAPTREKYCTADGTM
jgi:hypothetical protein